MLAVKALTFDVFGTVVDWRGSVAREAAAALGPKGFDLDWNGFALAWRARYQPALARVRSGGRGFVKLDVLHRENLLEVLEDFGVAGLSEAETDDLNRAWHRLDPWPDVLPGMARLGARYPLAALSNGNVALIVNMARRAGIPWDAILGAEVARAYKPMAQAYLSA
ncbi:MAG: HAD-IA family hydrolase, partial [Rhodospirillaceae bacterium]|nr:HAD-IA family hydrolase [Rhodospirillaceae bacterium]